MLPLLAVLLLAGCAQDPPAAPEEPPDDEGEGPGGAEPDDRRPGDLSVFARIPPVPGYPEGIHLWNGTVFVGTVPANQPGQAPVLYVFDRASGELRHEIEVDVVPGEFQGLAGMTVDGHGRLYVGDGGGGRVLRFTADGDTYVQETYAAIPDLPRCGQAPCSPTGDDRASLPNDLVFDEDGTLFVTDSFQATIWRIPPGGEAEVWFQHPDIDARFGPNCLRIAPDRAWMVFTVSGDVPVDTERHLMRVPFVPAPQAAQLEVVRVFTPNDFPDGCAYGASGRLYVGLNIQNQVIAMEPDGTEVGRWPDVRQNLESEIPVDFPASMVFDDDRRSLLLTNYAALWSTTPLPHPQPEHFAVLEMFVDDVSSGPARPVFDA